MKFIPKFLLPGLFFALGPMMAELPRLMPIWLAVTLLACLPICIAQRAEVKTLISKNILLALCAALAFTCASIGWSPSPRAADMALGVLLAMIGGVALIMTAQVMDETSRARILSWFALGWVLGAFILCGELFLDYPLFRWANGMTVNDVVPESVTKRGAALYALSLWPFAFIVSQRKTVFGYISAAVFFVLAAFLTSRSALFATLVAMVILFFAHYQAALARWVLMIAIGFGLLFAPVLAVMLPLAPQEFTGKFFDSAQHRLKIWALTAQHVADHPLFGNGIDASRGIESTVSAEATAYMPAGTSVISQHPHNIFLQIWLDLGLVGAVLWGGLLMLLADRTRFLPEAAQPYALAACYSSLCMLDTTYSILQAWWSAGHVATACILMCAAYTNWRKAATNGTSAGGIA